MKGFVPSNPALGSTSEVLGTLQVEAVSKLRTTSIDTSEWESVGGNEGARGSCINHILPSISIVIAAITKGQKLKILRVFNT